MPRRIKLHKRFPQENFKYGSIIISLFINKILKHGKKCLATKIFENTLSYIKVQTKRDPLYVLEKAVKEVSPKAKLFSKEIDDVLIEKPILLTPYQSVIYAINWIIESAKNRKNKKFAENLAYEIFDASQGRGNSIRKRDEMHSLLYDYIDPRTGEIIPEDDDDDKDADIFEE